MQDYVGQQIDRYRITERLGMGGMAVVYKAYDTRLERDVALKLIRTGEIPESQYDRLLKRFEREAKSQARFDHKHIVHVYDYGAIDGSPYLVMSYLPGETLKTRMIGPLDWQQAVRWLIPVAEALAYAHKRGVIHRDVKPANILFDDEGQPILTDFGIAKILETDEATLTGTGLGVGTPEYMAPEQWQGKPCEATDQYGLGVVLYELITGQKPYSADTPPAIILLQANEPLPAPSKLVNNIPEEVEKVLYKVLAKNPQDRFENMVGFYNAMKDLLLADPLVMSKPEIKDQPLIKTKHARNLDSESETVDTLGGELIAGMSTLPPQESGSHKEMDIKKPGKKLRWLAIGLPAVIIIGAIVLLSLWGMGIIPKASSGGSTPVSSNVMVDKPDTEEAEDHMLTSTPIQSAEDEQTALMEPEFTDTITTLFEQADCSVMDEDNRAYCDPTWPTLGHDISRTSWNWSEQVLTPPLNVAWQQTIEGFNVDNIMVTDSQIFLGGMVFLGGMDMNDYKNIVYSLELEGEQIWSYVLEQGNAAMLSTPAFYDGIIYFGGQDDDQLYAVNSSTGEVLWTVSDFGSLYLSSVLVDDDIIFGFGQKQLKAVDKEGLTLWSYPVDGWAGHLAAWQDYLIALSWDSSFIAFDKRSGKVMWERDDIGINLSEVVAVNDRVYVGASEFIFALDIIDGSTIWKIPLPIDLEIANRAVYELAYADGTLIAAGGVWASEDDPQPQQVLLALDAQSGEVLWHTEPAVSWGDIVIANDYLYVDFVQEFSVPGYFLALDLQSGEEVWRWQPDGEFWSLYYVVANQRLYLTYNLTSSGKSTSTIIAFENP